jgi:Chitobiase/beta-hexosaminidase C-terminal domain
MKNIRLIPILLLAVSASAATFPVTDSFSGSGPLSSNWTNTTAQNQGYTPLEQFSGQAIPSSPGTQGLAIYSGATFTNDQYSQVKFVNRGPGGSSTGPCVRMSLSGDGVCYLADLGQIYQLSAGGGVASIAGGCPLPSDGDTIQIAVVGTTYTCTDITTGGTASGSSSANTTGSPAILVDQRTSTVYALAQFQADCTPTCGGSTPPPSTEIAFTPPAATYNATQMVAITTTIPSASIYYTTDGSKPTTSSLLYTSPITVAASQTLNAIAVVSASAAYVISLPVAATPQFTPPAGTYNSTQSVTLTDNTPSATIYYTTDGSNPNTSSTVYTGPITVSTSETIKSIAVAPNFTQSIIASSSYTITAATSQTWYVNGVGGTRYSVNQANGQCNGKSAAAYPGSGVNQNCAFNDIRYLWTDGTTTTNPAAGAPAWGWIGSSGDTYLIDCRGGASCRVGQSGPNSGDGFGLSGDPSGAGAPPPISGTSSAHTRIFGINHAACFTPSAKAHINGGFGVNAVFSLVGVSYVDFGCFDITDFSSCGLSGQTNTCNTNFPLSDYAIFGIQTNNKTTNTTITDINVHGMAAAGMVGPTGDGVAVTRVALIGNAGAGWNMDDNTGTTGTGRLTISFLTVNWNGCAEEYPIVDSQPYTDCTDDQSGGYGDGLGTATETSNPAWTMSIDHSLAANNTQDGFDLLHLQGGGSTILISRSLMYGNMGQQLKLGTAGFAVNNLIVGNCNALRQAIPGTPSGYNSRLSDFCRASDVAVVMAVADGGLETRFVYNTLYSANAIGVEVDPNGTCTTTCYLQYENNIFLGFQNNLEDGYPNGGNLKFPTPIYFGTNQILSSPGSAFTNNATFHPRDGWPCPQNDWNEQNAVCADPGLVDETFHVFGFGNMSVASDQSAVVGRGAPVPAITTDLIGIPRSTTAPTIGALERRVPTLLLQLLFP